MPETLASHIAQGCDGRIRTLIVGAGIAGLTLAALLRQRGEHPAIVEHAPDLDQAGYNLVLYPLGSRVLHGLGLFDRFLKVSVPAPYCRLGNGRGEIVHDFDMSSLLKAFGPIQGIRRAELLHLLKEALGEVAIHFGTTVATLENRDRLVRVTFSDGSSAEFDLVIGADGLHSETRQMVLAEKEFAYRDTGWACWVAWAVDDLLPEDTSLEFWGAGRGLGVYPVRGARGVVLVGPKAVMEKKAGCSSPNTYARNLAGGRVPSRQLPMRSATAATPSFGICTIVGAACGRVAGSRCWGTPRRAFCRPRGLGPRWRCSRRRRWPTNFPARMRRISNTRCFCTNDAIAGRVEAAQENSRRLAKMMLIESRPLAWGRDQLMRFYTLDRALKDIVAIMDGSL